MTKIGKTVNYRLLARQCSERFSDMNIIETSTAH